ncbi:hypothetical protein SELMODRAFT_415793 [Selaginella moellendorffii]|uniref:USP domain-containing protein n=1 Tax=Selaginella moellendorffii TaxID=88036 RepID=D8RX92_SELML|nr:hypothetical protein SELMODRAFT_415793 [Selaginella moellendorffii]
MHGNVKLADFRMAKHAMPNFPVPVPNLSCTHNVAVSQESLCETHFESTRLTWNVAATYHRPELNLSERRREIHVVLHNIMEQDLERACKIVRALAELVKCQARDLLPKSATEWFLRTFPQREATVIGNRWLDAFETDDINADANISYQSTLNVVEKLYRWYCCHPDELMILQDKESQLQHVFSEAVAENVRSLMILEEKEAVRGATEEKNIRAAAGQVEVKDSVKQAITTASEHKLVGIPNIRRTCDLSSTIQALSSHKTLWRTLGESFGLFKELFELHKKINNGEACDARAMHQQVAALDPNFAVLGQDQDAHEFLVLLFNEFEKVMDCKEVKLKFKHVCKCVTCGVSNLSFEETTHWLLHIPNGGDSQSLDLETCIDFDLADENVQLHACTCGSQKLASNEQESYNLCAVVEHYGRGGHYTTVAKANRIWFSTCMLFYVRNTEKGTK